MDGIKETMKLIPLYLIGDIVMLWNLLANPWEEYKFWIVFTVSIIGFLICIGSIISINHEYKNKLEGD